MKKIKIKLLKKLEYMERLNVGEEYYLLNALMSARTNYPQIVLIITKSDDTEENLKYKGDDDTNLLGYSLKPQSQGGGNKHRKNKNKKSKRIVKRYISKRYKNRRNKVTKRSKRSKKLRRR